MRTIGQTKEEIKGLRLEIDGVAQMINSLPGAPVLYNVYMANICTVYAKAWLGKLLGEFGDNDSPYKDGKKTVADIEPTAERMKLPSLEEQQAYIKGLSAVESLDILRQKIGKLSDQVKALTDLPSSREAAICRTQAWVYLCDARFALGFQLELIKAEHDKAV